MKNLVFLILLSLTSCLSGQDSINEVKLDLSGKKLDVIPDSVFNKADLTYLDLGSSEVVFFPPLSTLVDTNANNLKVLPEKIDRLKNLQTLVLNTNKLDSLPTSITNLDNLENLDIALNKSLDLLKELPKLKQLKNLKVLKITGIEPISKETINTLINELPNVRVVFSIKEYFEIK